MLVLMKYEDDTVRAVESTDVEEVVEPLKGVVVRIADTDEYISIKANDPDRECLSLRNIFISGHLNLIDYGVVVEDYSEEEELKEQTSDIDIATKIVNISHKIACIFWDALCILGLAVIVGKAVQFLLTGLMKLLLDIDTGYIIAGCVVLVLCILAVGITMYIRKREKRRK